MSKRLSNTVQPLVTPRRLITYGLLLTSLAVILVAQMSFQRPGMWRWAMSQPESPEQKQEVADHQKPPSPGISQAFLSELLRAEAYLGDTGQSFVSPGSLLGAWLSHEAVEFVPLPEPTVVGRPRHAPYPDRRLLAGAADGEPFLVPAKDIIPELQASAKAAGDAQARYHLLQLAHEAQPGSLSANAQDNVRYQALRQKPQEHRGELISVSGTLISIGEPFELQRKIPGLEYCYLGVIAADAPKQSYLIFFIDLPDNLPKNQAEWQQLYLHDVRFAGYFYKMAKFQQKGKKEPWLLPVLVGKSLQLPSRVASADSWFNLISVFVLMALPVVIIALALPRFFRHREARQRQMMEKYRSRRSAQEVLSFEAPKPALSDESTHQSDDQVHRMREGLAPPEWN